LDKKVFNTLVQNFVEKAEKHHVSNCQRELLAPCTILGARIFPKRQKYEDAPRQVNL
jgi:hypothetical protein